MDFQKITQGKYLRYFISGCEHSVSDAIMTEFLDDMISVSEHMDTRIPPTEIVKETMGKLGLEGSVLSQIIQIANSDLVETLNALEVFTHLWFVTCRNTFTYEEEIYLNMANNKTIGNLLKRLSEIYA